MPCKTRRKSTYRMLRYRDERIVAVYEYASVGDVTRSGADRAHCWAFPNMSCILWSPQPCPELSVTCFVAPLLSACQASRLCRAYSQNLRPSAVPGWNRAVRQLEALGERAEARLLAATALHPGACSGVWLDCRDHPGQTMVGSTSKGFRLGMETYPE